jgi:hypothetical protein
MKKDLRMDGVIGKKLVMENEETTRLILKLHYTKTSVINEKKRSRNADNRINMYKSDKYKKIYLSMNIY